MQFHLLVPEFKQFCIREKGLRFQSYKVIIQHIQQLLDFLQKSNIRSIQPTEIREYLYTTSIERAWSPKTFRNNLQSINSFYNWALKKHYVRKNPAKNIEKPKLPKPLPRYLTEKEAKQIEQQAKKSQWSSLFIQIRNYTVIATFLQTGIRLNELRQLKNTDIDFQQKTLKVRMGKGQKMRLIPIHPNLKMTLKQYKNFLEQKHIYSHWLFPSSRTKSPLSPKYIQDICRKISIETGIKFTPHMLRHTFGRRCTDQNLPFFKLKQIMGHSSIVTTERYASISMTGLQESFNKIHFH